LRFIAAGKDATRVELEHQHDEMRAIFDKEGDSGQFSCHVRPPQRKENTPGRRATDPELSSALNRTGLTSRLELARARREDAERRTACAPTSVHKSHVEQRQAW
jgi:hypothetical protein